MRKRILRIIILLAVVAVAAPAHTSSLWVLGLLPALALYLLAPISVIVVILTPLAIAALIWHHGRTRSPRHTASQNAPRASCPAQDTNPAGSLAGRESRIH